MSHIDLRTNESDSEAEKPTRRPQTSAIRSRIQKAMDHPMADYGFLLGAVIVLVCLGLMMVLSASNVLSYQIHDGNGYVIATRQAMFAGVGIVLMLIASRFPPSFFRRFANIGLYVAVALLLLVLVPGIGVEVAGQRNWIDLGGPFRLQPSEFAKLAMVVWAAKLLSSRHDMIDGWKALMWPFAPVTGGIIVLIVLEGDLGTAMILMVIMAGMLMVAGAPKKIFAALAALFVCAVIMLSIAAPYRMQRFMTWLDPGSDPTGAGWQIIHGHYALATGGWWGVGLGGSREKWGFLPEGQTDFILAVVGEELGIVGTFLVLGLFVTITFFILRIALRAQDRFVQLAAAGIGLWIIAQALLNIGAVIGALPIAGVPLPLVSYGGSSLTFTLLAFGMVLAFARSEPEAQEFLAERDSHPRGRAAIKVGGKKRERRERELSRGDIRRREAREKKERSEAKRRARAEDARAKESGERRQSSRPSRRVNRKLQKSTSREGRSHSSREKDTR